jgi:hypothetical protein
MLTLFSRNKTYTCTDVSECSADTLRILFFMKNSNLLSFNKFSLKKCDPKDYVKSWMINHRSAEDTRSKLRYPAVDPNSENKSLENTDIKKKLTMIYFFLLNFFYLNFCLCESDKRDIKFKRSMTFFLYVIL